MSSSATSINSRSTTSRVQFSCRRLGCLLLLLALIPVGVLLAFLTIISPPVGAAPAAPLPAHFMKGISYVSYDTLGEIRRFSSAESDQTLREIVVPSGANWLAVVVTCYQQSATSTEIHCDDATDSDDDLRHVIRRAQALGLSVMLKPHVDLREMQDATTGRFMIGFGEDEAAWAGWFASYTRFITHYATLAQEMGAAHFVVGTELGGTAHRDAEWRAVVEQVRAVYDGRITYAALTYLEPLQITWWDALDAIGIDAYFGVTLTTNPTLEQIRLGWMPTVSYLEWLANHWSMPLILTEVGYMSVDGTNILPGFWSLDGKIDPQEQALAYQGLIEAFRGRSWFEGIFWWVVSTNPQQGGLEDRGYSFNDKPAEEVLRRFFRAGVA